MGNTDNTDKFIFTVHCINHFFSARTKEGIKNISTEVQIPVHNSSDMHNTMNTKEDGKQLGSVNIINDTTAFPNKRTHDEFNLNKAEHANHEVCIDNYKQTTENDITVINDEELNQEFIKESLMTTESSSQYTKDTDVIQIIQTNYKNEKISQPCNAEVPNDSIQNIIVKLDEKMDDLSHKVIHMSVSIDDIKLQIEQHRMYNGNRDERQVSVRFHAEIDPTKNASAETELRKEISQDMFAKVSNDIHILIGFQTV
jgi:hypothetical protein